MVSNRDILWYNRTVATEHGYIMVTDHGGLVFGRVLLRSRR